MTPPAPAARAPGTSSGLWLVGLFAWHSFAPGLWMASLGAALERAGLGAGWATAILSTSAVAALVSPLASASFSDLRFGPVRTLGALSFAAAGFLAVASLGLQRGWPPGLLLACYLGQALAYLPTWGLVNAATFAHLGAERRQAFPLYRVWGTIGWMSAGWMVGPLFHADASPRGGLWAAGLLAGQGIYCLAMPRAARTEAAAAVGWSELLGGGVQELWRQRTVRGAVLTALLLALPLAAFYPYTSRMLLDFGVDDPSARLSWGQTTEVLAMFAFAWLVRRWGEKPLMLAGTLLALARYVLYALGWQWREVGWVQAGITLHGVQYALFSVSIYLLIERSVAEGWRARAQALLTVLCGGVGGIAGLGLAGIWHAAAVRLGLDWAAFWWAWSALCLPPVVLAWRFRPEGE